MEPHSRHSLVECILAGDNSARVHVGHIYQRRTVAACSDSDALPDSDTDANAVDLALAVTDANRNYWAHRHDHADAVDHALVLCDPDHDPIWVALAARDAVVVGVAVGLGVDFGHSISVTLSL